MPFQSEKQRRYMHANLPDIANRWEAKYGLGGIAELNSQLNQLPEYYLPKNQGGRIGYDKGLKVLPKIDITQSSSTPESGIDVTERDITYGLEGLLQGDNLYAGGEFQTGNVNVNVQKDGNTVFEDTMSQEDLKKLYIGLGQKEGDRVEVGTDRKGNYTLNIVKSFNQGGFIPSHEAGIYGLAEGGSIAGGHQIGTPIGNRTGFGSPHDDSPTGSGSSSSGTGGSTSTSTSGGEGGHGNVAHGPGGRFETANTRTTKTTTTPDRGDGPINIHEDTIEVIEEQKKTDEINRRNALRQMVRDRSEKTETWEKKQQWNKPETSIWKKIGIGAAIITGVAPLLGFQAPAAVQTVAQLNALHNKATFALDKFNQYNKTDYTLEGLYNKVTNIETADKKIMESLPKGHPERIALEAQMKIKTPPKGPDGEGGDKVDITMDVEAVNDANADKVALEQKYEEMDEGSLLAWQRQQEMQAKKEAYLRNFRNTYVMASHGGRVPGGYNTGGLSNLFRLKNV